MLRLVKRLLAPVKRQIRQLLTRGLVQLVDAETMVQLLQVELRRGEILDNVEHFQPYGFTSHPHAGAEVLAASMSGRRSHTVAIVAFDRRFRLKNTQPGEVALFTDEGDVIHFKRNNEIFIDTQGTLIANAAISATVTAPAITLNGAVVINGTLAVSGAATFASTVAAAGAMSSATSLADPVGTMQSIRVIFDGHNHNENDNGGPTDQPNQSMT